MLQEGVRIRLQVSLFSAKCAIADSSLFYLGGSWIPRFVWASVKMGCGLPHWATVFLLHTCHAMLHYLLYNGDLRWRDLEWLATYHHPSGVSFFDIALSLAFDLAGFTFAMKFPRRLRKDAGHKKGTTEGSSYWSTACRLQFTVNFIGRGLGRIYDLY